MRHLFSTFALSLVFLPIQSFAITDKDISEISERLESLSTDQLIERREILLAQVDTMGEDEYEDGCDNGIDDDNDGDLDGDDSDCSSAALLPT